MATTEHTVIELRDYFSVPGKPVDAKEMMAFWKSLTEEEKNYYKTAPLT